jgi:AhpD family alkylhydroperoxidase
MSDRLEDFTKYREKMNERILKTDHLGIKRFFNLDTNTYKDGELDAKTKELLGLVASLVLRCNDCIDYHVIQCVDVGWDNDEIIDAASVGLIIGGSIVIPHFRHLMETLDLCRQKNGKG